MYVSLQLVAVDLSIHLLLCKKWVWLQDTHLGALGVGQRVAVATVPPVHVHWFVEHLNGELLWEIPPGRFVPRGQGEQEICPTLSWYVFWRQLSQSVLPGIEEKVPRGQGEHWDVPTKRW